MIPVSWMIFDDVLMFLYGHIGVYLEVHRMSFPIWCLLGGYILLASLMIDCPGRLACGRE